MALTREYYPSDTIKLINQSEHYSNRFDGHALGRHLVASVPNDPELRKAMNYPAKGGVSGSLGDGQGIDGFKARFANNLGKTNSGWAGRGDMAILLTEVLNSDVGQKALQVLDGGSDRVFVHYLNEHKMGLAKNAKFMSATTVRFAPWQEQSTKQEWVNKTRRRKGFWKDVPFVINHPSRIGVKLTANDIIAVDALLLRDGGYLHLQTLFPSSDGQRSYCEWKIGRVKKYAMKNQQGHMTTYNG